MHDLAEQLRLEGTTQAEAKQCRAAFAMLPRVAQKAIVDADIAFKLSRQPRFDTRYTDDGSVEFGDHNLWAGKNEPAILSALFFGFGLAKALEIDPSGLPLHEVAKWQFNSNMMYELGTLGLNPNRTVGGLNGVTLEDEQAKKYTDNLTKYLANEPQFLAAEALEGAYVGKKRGAKQIPLQDSIYDTYLQEANKRHPEEAAKDNVAAAPNTNKPAAPTTDLSAQLRIKNASAEQKKQLRDAFATLPQPVQKVLVAERVTIVVSQNPTPEHVIGKNIIIPGRHFEEVDPNDPTRSLLQPDILGRGLVAVFPNIIESALQKKVEQEVTAKHLESVDKDRNVPRAIKKALNSLPRQETLGTALGSVYVGSPAGEASQAVYKIYMDAVEKKYLAMGGSQTFKASDTAFAINEMALTAPQQQYFAKLNEAIALLGVSPKEFDDEFQYRVIGLIQFMGRNAAARATRSYDPQYAPPDDLSTRESTPSRLEYRFSYKNSNGKYKYDSGSLFGQLQNAYTSGQDHFLRRQLGLALPLTFNPEQQSSTSRDVNEPNVIQAFCASEKHLEYLEAGPEMRHNIGTVTFAHSQAYFKTGMEYALHALKEDKKLTGENAEKLDKILAEMAALEPQITLSKEEYERVQAKAARKAQSGIEGQAAKEEAAKRAEELRAQAEKERQRAAEEAAKKPQPFILPETIAKSESTLAHDEMVPLANAFDRRIPVHKALSDVLFATQITDIAAAYLAGADRDVRTLLALPQYKQALAAAKQAVEDFLKKPAEQIPEAERAATDAVKAQLLASPVFLALLLGDMKEMNKLKQLTNNPYDPELPELKRLTVMDDGEKGFLRISWPAMAAVLLPPVKEKPIIVETQPPPPPAPVEVQKPVVVATPSPPPPSPKSPEEPPVVVAPPPPPPPLSDEEEAKAKHKTVFDAALKKALSDVDMFTLSTLDEGYNRFQCAIDLKRPNFPIDLKFANKDGKTRAFTITEYAQEFANHGLTMTLEDAVDLKIAVQSQILNVDGIEPLRDTSARGVNGVKIDHMLPLHAKDPEKRTLQVKDSNGVLSLEINASDRTDRSMVTASIPLGLPDEPQYKLTAEEWSWINGTGFKTAQPSETAERIHVVTSFIESKGNQKQWVTKRDVIEHLDRYIAAHSKEWVSRDNIALSGYSGETVLHMVTNDSGRAVQKITLSPVALHMDPGGDNPTWHMDFSIHANNNPNDSGYGDQLRGRSVNLHTSNKELALARAKQSMDGVTTNDIRTPGFVEMIKQHVAEHPHDRWVKIGPEGGHGQVQIGAKNLQDFIDDMKRYEDDIGVQCTKEPAKDGNLKFTLKALRATRPDLQETAKPDPRVICIKDENKNRQEVKVTLSVPEAKADKIDAFAKAVESAVQWHASEKYSSVAINGKEGKELPRKKVQEYRAATVKNSLVRAIETLHQQYFGMPYVHPNGKSEIGGGGFAERIKLSPDAAGAGAWR